jgi:hypothetical protein
MCKARHTKVLRETSLFPKCQLADWHGGEVKSLSPGRFLSGRRLGIVAGHYQFLIFTSFAPLDPPLLARFLSPTLLTDCALVFTLIALSCSSVLSCSR